jgi:GNAT superfamily N-acetyltransferase
VSDYYAVRRTTIADLVAFLGFLVGFIGSSPIAWPYLSVGFTTGNITSGFFYFIVIICGSGVIGGLVGLAVGHAVARVWEQAHRSMRGLRKRGVGPATRDAQLAALESRPAPRATPHHALAEIRYDPVPDAAAFTGLARRVWSPPYDTARLADALQRTVNIGAWHGDRLVGAARVLSDGAVFATVPELMVDPAYRSQGIGTELVRRALQASPSGLLVLGAPPQVEGFIRRLGGEQGPWGITLRQAPS